MKNIHIYACSHLVPCSDRAVCIDHVHILHMLVECVHGRVRVSTVWADVNILHIPIPNRNAAKMDLTEPKQLRAGL